MKAAVKRSRSLGKQNTLLGDHVASDRDYRLGSSEFNTAMDILVP
jgi:hypothetical protein